MKMFQIYFPSLGYTHAMAASTINGLTLLNRGKVRDIYKLPDKQLLMVASDRISAFDVILPDLIPGKGKVLTAISHFWFQNTAHIIPNHMETLDIADVIDTASLIDTNVIHDLRTRSMVVKQVQPLPIEAIVRGYLIGSGWKEYQQNQSVCGIPLPANLQLAEQLTEPIFTPSTKAEVGRHDINVSFAHISNIIGTELVEKIKQVSLLLYATAKEYALTAGIIIADTKFEFGLDDEEQLILIDEVLTPDSSRFWSAGQYKAGINPACLDKQFVRDYLESLSWNKTPPAPRLPQHIINKTAEKYRQAQSMLIQSGTTESINA